MHFYHSLADVTRSERGIALAIGNFDGFHRGHQAVVARMKAKASARNLETAVMVFEPHPVEFFDNGRHASPRLYSLRDKLLAFSAAGIDKVFCMHFNHQFAALSAEEFVELLAKRIGVVDITVGTPFSFGSGGKAGIGDLQRLGALYGIKAESIDKVCSDDERISSTSIRAFLSEGDFDSAIAALGHNYDISGRVVFGNHLGRKIGFPTANVNLQRMVSPLLGVYAVKVRTSYGVFNGVANVGYRPTVVKDQVKSLMEVHLIDFNHDLYGQMITVYFFRKLRDERKFASLEELKEHITCDKNNAQAVLEDIDLK
ncbi:MAG: bifunctional riboflavin kinase/FAD synthetase [Succinivibrio sp.]|nr:bifunctional riboflavin kinase/FAD synthetase [Succinivibrio sp.]